MSFEQADGDNAVRKRGSSKERALRREKHQQHDSWRFSEKRSQLCDALQATIELFQEIVSTAEGSHPHTKRHAHACSSALHHLIALAEYKQEQPLSYVFVGQRTDRQVEDVGVGVGAGAGDASEDLAAGGGNGTGAFVAGPRRPHSGRHAKKQRTIAYSIADNTRRLLISFIVARRKFIAASYIDKISVAVNAIRATYFD